MKSSPYVRCPIPQPCQHTRWLLGSPLGLLEAMPAECDPRPVCRPPPPGMTCEVLEQSLAPVRAIEVLVLMYVVRDTGSKWCVCLTSRQDCLPEMRQ